MNINFSNVILKATDATTYSLNKWNSLKDDVYETYINNAYVLLIKDKGKCSVSFTLEFEYTEEAQEMRENIIQYINSLDINIVDVINSQPAWGRKQILTLPYGPDLAKEMAKINKTSLGTKEIIYLLFGIKAKVIGFTYYNEFVEMMKQQKTMINKKTAQELLRTFWENTKDDYKTNPLLFNIIKTVIINLNNSLINNNSTQQLRIRFMEEFLVLTTNVPNSVKSTP